MWILLYFFHRIHACRKHFVKLYQFISSDYFSNDYKKNGKVIHKYFNEKYVISLDYIKKNWWNKILSLKEIKDNDLMSEKYKNIYSYLNYVENFLILISTVTCCVSVSSFASLVCVPVGITRSAVEIKKMCNHCRNQEV